MNKKITSFICGMLTIHVVIAQPIKIPENLNTAYPRLITNAWTGRTELKRLMSENAWAKSTYDAIELGVKPYVLRHQSDSSWIVSRLQMYWTSHATDVYIKNGAFASTAGKAPAPTVRFTGTRDAATVYLKPRLEDIKPYMDEDGKIYLQNKSADGQPWEWVAPSKTGRLVEAINIDIMNKARDAAMIYWFTGDEHYARFAAAIFETYLTGMYYRNEPIDLNHGHDQTLVGLSSFEVIHEDVLEPLTACYDFLHGYLENHHPQQIAMYDQAFKKWAEIIIKNGVPFNNWNLIEARFVLHIAMVLKNDDQYANHKGCQYYLDQILNRTQTRQWAIPELLKKGYDPQTGIWSECPGYAIGVLGDFTGYLNFFDRTLKMDLLPSMPILPKAVIAQAQYLFPNGYIAGFGDTHYGHLPAGSIENMIRNSRVYGKWQQEAVFTRLLKMIQHFNGQSGDAKRGGFNSLFGNSPLKLNDSIEAGRPEEYLTPTFWSPNVSWMVQRNGLDVNNGLMISQAGSSGNHAHANGIAMELYGKGLILAPESGIGGSYFQNDYAEYYSQFPAHNTVVIDGVSSYPAMKSNHPLKLEACYPRSGQSLGYFPGVTFSDVTFLEPETNADQDRLMSIVRTSDTSGYYVDIFRSRRKDGQDKSHDYIYHNLGQQLTLYDNREQALILQPTDKLTFANAELLGYDYWWDKRSVTTSQDFKGRFDLRMPNGKSVAMNIWMKGYPEREIFSVKAPPSRSFRPNEMIPDSVSNMPLPTLVVRQQGQAWTRPFTAIYEPSNGTNGSVIKAIKPLIGAAADSTFVGICVQNKNGLDDYILSDKGIQSVAYADLRFKGCYGLIRKAGKQLTYLFIGKGYYVAQGAYRLESSRPVAAGFELTNGQFHFTADEPVQLTIPVKDKRRIWLSFYLNRKLMHIAGKIKRGGVGTQATFSLPAMPWGAVEVIYQ